MPLVMYSEFPSNLITTYLQMLDVAAFKPAFVDEAAHALAVMPLDVVDVAYYRFLYQAVGEGWRWRDRAVMPDDDLRAALSAEGVRVHVLYMAGAPAGYIELAQTGADVEIVYLGVRAPFMGRGLGKHLLSWGIRAAWQMDGVRRVWVHTCNLDSPHAIENYQRRGFSVYHVETVPMPERYRDGQA